MFNLTDYRNEIKTKIQQLKETLSLYKYEGDPHSEHMVTILQEEINTLKWSLKLTFKYESNFNKINN